MLDGTGNVGYLFFNASLSDSMAGSAAGSEAGPTGEVLEAATDDVSAAKAQNPTERIRAIAIFEIIEIPSYVKRLTPQGPGSEAVL